MPGEVSYRSVKQFPTSCSVDVFCKKKHKKDTKKDIIFLMKNYMLN